MKRCAAWVAALVMSLLAFYGGTLPAAPATAPAAAGGDDAKSAPGTPTELLASKGLTKAGPAYVLRAERDLADGLKQVAAARAKMNDENKGRSRFEREVARAKAAYAQLEFERKGQMTRLETAKDPTMQNQLIAKINNLTTQMKEAIEYKDKQEAELNKVGEDNKTKYVNLILDLAAEAEKAQKEYDEMGAEADVKSALEQAKAKLGPTAEFLANVGQIKRLGANVSSETIEVKMEGGVPMIEVTMNKSFTRSMVLDTGASIIALPADLAKSMELIPGKDDPIAHLRLADGKVVEAKVTMLKSVRVGSFTVENVECAVLPPELVAAEPLLGGSFLKHFIYKLDPKAGKLHLAQFGAEGAGAKPGDKPKPGEKPVK